MKITTTDKTGTKYLVSWNERDLSLMWSHSKDKAYNFGAEGKLAVEAGNQLVEWISETLEVQVRATD